MIVWQTEETTKAKHRYHDNRDVSLGVHPQHIGTRGWMCGCNHSGWCRGHSWWQRGGTGLSGAGRSWFGDFNGNEGVGGTVLTQVFASFLLILLPAYPPLCCCSLSRRQVLQGPVTRPKPGIQGRSRGQSHLRRSRDFRRHVWSVCHCKNVNLFKQPSWNSNYGCMLKLGFIWFYGI